MYKSANYPTSSVLSRNPWLCPLYARASDKERISCKQRVWVGLSDCCPLAAWTSDAKMPSAQSSQNHLDTFLSPTSHCTWVLKTGCVMPASCLTQYIHDVFSAMECKMRGMAAHDGAELIRSAPKLILSHRGLDVSFQPTDCLAL